MEKDQIAWYAISTDLNHYSEYKKWCEEHNIHHRRSIYGISFLFKYEEDVIAFLLKFNISNPNIVEISDDIFFG